MTDTQTSVLPHVETLAQQTLALSRQHQEREQRRQADQTRQKEQQQAAVLRTLLETELEPDLLAVLNIRYITHRDRGEASTSACFPYAGLDWHLRQEMVSRQSLDWRWSIRAATGSSGWYLHEASASPLCLRTTLLLTLGERLETVGKQAQEAEVQQRRRRQAEADEQAERERQERERTAHIAQADQEDARLRAEIDALKEQTLATMWRWPAGVRIAIYRLASTTAVGRGEDGDAVIEQESGWTSVDRLDDDGYIRLEASKTSWGGRAEAEEVKLDPATHMPIWKRMMIESVDDLPAELREEITVGIPSVVSRSNRDLDRKCRLVQVETSQYDERAYCEQVGSVPLAWVRTLAEQAAQKVSR